MIRVEPIAVTVRPLNERLWELHQKCASDDITDAELTELDLMCAALEAGQDIHGDNK